MKNFLIVLFAIIIIGCSTENQNDVSLALDWYPNSNHSGIYSAIDQGFF